MASEPNIAPVDWSQVPPGTAVYMFEIFGGHKTVWNEGTLQKVTPTSVVVRSKMGNEFRFHRDNGKIFGWHWVSSPYHIAPQSQPEPERRARTAEQVGEELRLAMNQLEQALDNLERDAVLDLHWLHIRQLVAEMRALQAQAVGV